MKQLTEDISAVEVPEDAINFSIEKDAMYYKASFGPIANVSRLNPNIKSRDYKLVGTVTADEIDFDVEPYVENDEMAGEVVDGKFSGLECYKNYVSGFFQCIGKNDSFRSLLTSKGIHFVNPYGAKPCQPRYSGYCQDFCQGDCWTKEDIDQDEWQTAENALVKKIVIIQKVKQDGR